MTDEELLVEIEQQWRAANSLYGYCVDPDHVRWLINRVHALLANQTQLTDTIGGLIERLHVVTAERDALIVERSVAWGQKS